MARRLHLVSLATLCLAASSAYAADPTLADQTFYATLTARPLTPVAQLPGNAVGVVVSGLGSMARPGPGLGGGAPKATIASSLEPRAALAYAVIRVDAQSMVAPARLNDSFALGERVAVAVANNVPGILDITSIDAQGQRMRLETVVMTDVKQVLAPAQGGFYPIGPNPPEVMSLELRFFPCAPTQPESMAAGNVVTELAGKEALKGAAFKALGGCPSQGQRDAIKTQMAKTLRASDTTMVAVADTVLERPAQGVAPTPVLATIRIARSK